MARRSRTQFQRLRELNPPGKARILSGSFFLLAGGLVLSFADISFPMKAVVFLLGFLAPWVWMIRGEKKAGSPASFPAKQGFFPGAWTPLWLGLILAGGFLRFYRLTDFRPWMAGDEGLQGFFALELIRKWDWRFFYTSGQHPPLLIWMLRFLFQISDHPFFNLWFLPALFSALSLGAAYAAASRFFSRKISLIFCALWAFSFWPLLSGRFCVQGALVPFFELVCFWILGLYWEASSTRARVLRAALLGAWLGLGALTFMSWLVVAAFVLVLAVIEAFRGGWKEKTSLWVLGGSFILFFSPWMIAAVREGLGRYVWGVSIFSGFFTWKQQFLNFLSYFTCLFWGPLDPDAAYGSIWGGLLNPLLGTLFWLGAVEIYRQRRSAQAQALAAAFAVFLMPGSLSADHVEVYRIVQVLPVLLLVSAKGLERWLTCFPSGKQTVFLVLLLGSSFLLDGYHLFHPRLAGPLFQGKIQNPMEDENLKAYQILRRQADAFGPGLVFTDFLLLSHGHTLSVAVYPFNAAQNPRLAVEQAHWAGIVANVHYAPFLQVRFPEARWFSVAVGQPNDGGLAVGIIPIRENNETPWGRWVLAHRFFHRLNVLSEDMMNDAGLYQSTLGLLPGGYHQVEGDPFLESCYGEWLAQYHYGPNLDRNIAALQRAVQKGYPAANLDYKLGNFLWRNHQEDEALKAYRAAVRCRFNETAAAPVLKYLEGSPRP